MFYSDKELEMILIFSLLASVLFGISHLIFYHLLQLDQYIFYQINFFFNAIRFVCILVLSFYISDKWREMGLKRILVSILILLSISTLCALQMKKVTHEGIIFSTAISRDMKSFEDVSLVQVKDTISQFAGRLSYTVTFDDGKKIKCFDPFNIHEGEQMLFLKSKVKAYEPVYEIDEIEERVYKKLLYYERLLLNEH